MLVTADMFSALLQALGLSRGLYKPTPGSSFASSSTPFISNNLQVRPVSLLSSPADDLYTVAPYGAPAPCNVSLSPFDHAKATVYRYRQQQSVNLGSWFVQEQWMMPSLFTCASGRQLSELDIASGCGSTSAARAVLERHWDTFINQSDFDYLASIGINTVRLPIGYWSLGPYYCQDTPFAAFADVYENSWVRVLRAINMAEKSGIGVLVDLHGAVGSQNGQPHSGISDGEIGLFSDPVNMNKTITVLNFLTEQLANATNVVGIQILNEPQNAPELLNFYSRAITSMRQVSSAATTFPLYLHDGFDLERLSTYISERQDFVIQDHHSYFVYTPSDETEPASQHTVDVRNAVADSLARASDRQRRNLVVDEWSCALTPDSIAHEPNPDQVRKDFCIGQKDVYANATAGWGFWSYNKENCDPDWCFKAAVGGSLPKTFFTYGQGSITDPLQQQSVATFLASMAPPATSDILASAQSSLPSLTSERSSWPTNTVSKRNTAPYRARLESIHHRRQSRSDSLAATHNECYGKEVASTEQSIAKGYADGFLTAKIFAMQNASKLGFIGQYILDSITALGPGVIACGTEDIYSEWFLKGLQDGEEIVVSVLR